MLALGGSGLLALAGAHAAFSRPRGTDGPVDIRVEARPLGPFRPDMPAQTRFGGLTYRCGVSLTSSERSFGGLSALWRSADGRDLVAMSDNAMWLTAQVVMRDGLLSGLDHAAMAPLLDQDGGPLCKTRAYDTEGLAFADGVAFVGIERVHEVRRFTWARDGVLARGEPISVPPEVKTLPANSSLEAVGVAPAAHPLAGAVIGIAEQARPGDDAPTRGWVLTGPETGDFDVVRSAGFDITDIAFLDTGEALLLERRYTVIDGVACRIRRLARDAIRPGASVDGPTIFEADRAYAMDNMEGIATHRDPASGARVVTLVSDDNFSPAQRTLLLEFTLDG
jgi:hypothetical protein